MKKKHKRLTLNERIIIETLLYENKSKSYIAKHLNRNRSTITREVNSWMHKPADKYNATLADFFADAAFLARDLAFLAAEAFYFGEADGEAAILAAILAAFLAALASFLAETDALFAALAAFLAALEAFLADLVAFLAEAVAFLAALEAFFAAVLALDALLEADLPGDFFNCFLKKKQV